MPGILTIKANPFEIVRLLTLVARNTLKIMRSQSLYVKIENALKTRYIWQTQMYIAHTLWLSVSATTQQNVLCFSIILRPSEFQNQNAHIIFRTYASICNSSVQPAISRTLLTQNDMSRRLHTINCRSYLLRTNR